MDVAAWLFFTPLGVAVLFPFLVQKRVQYLLVSIAVAVLMIAAASLYFTFETIVGTTLEFSGIFETLLVVADSALLLFFAHQGRRYNNTKVLALALLQLLLYWGIEIFMPHIRGTALYIDSLSGVMFLIINIVGGLIVWYALAYMRDEAMSEMKKRLFISYSMLFLAIMNAIVIANSMMLFFLLFEMTTLSSYLLIAYRGDAHSRQNALRALWMNQVGGVAILLGTIVAIEGFETLYFTELLAQNGGTLLAATAFLAMAALVKGASLPFDRWLLGAMIAPTPVSAMLHSATMVKIAPFLILKLSVLLTGTFLGTFLSVIGVLVFVAASYLALSKKVFKEILGYSTIGLLGLMMALAAMGTNASFDAALVLMVFHAVSKALLFLTAGWIEKAYHFKDIEAMAGLVEKAPKSVALILLGFISLTLPPFGLFLGKVWAIEITAGMLHENLLYLVVLLGMLVGSVLMVLLYFKVASALFSNRDDTRAYEREQIPLSYGFALYALAFLIFVLTVTVIIMFNSDALYLLGVPLIIAIVLTLLLGWLKRFERSRAYHCGETATFESALFYYALSVEKQMQLERFFTLLFVLIALVGVCS